MPRHVFSFPIDVRNAVRSYVNNRVQNINPRRYRQEPDYVPVLVHSLEGIAYEGNHGSVEFKGTVFDSLGRGSAENRSGADFAITANISDGVTNISKAIIFQAKLGELDSLSPNELKRLEEQIEKMKRLTRAPKVLEISNEGDSRVPSVVSGNAIVAGNEYKNTPLGDYFVRRVLTTLDGDTRDDFVDLVKDSSLPQLRVIAKKS